jgi:hypothetical protein
VRSYFSTAASAYAGARSFSATPRKTNVAPSPARTTVGTYAR